MALAVDAWKKGVATFLEAALGEERALAQMVCLGFSGGLLT